MEKIVGVLTDIKERTVTTKAGKTVLAYDIYVDGVKYGHGFSFPAFGIGDRVELQYDPADQYRTARNVVAASQSSQQGPVGNKAPGSTRSKSGFPIPLRDGQRSIIRQNCLAHARELVLHSTGKSDNTPKKRDAIANEVIRVARLFEAYAAGDIEREEADKLVSLQEE